MTKAPVKRGKGSLSNIGSLAGHVGSPGLPRYASWWGIEGDLSSAKRQRARLGGSADLHNAHDR